MDVIDYLSAIVRPILSKPDDLVITKTSDDMGILLHIRVNKDDMHFIIGKSGETAKSIRHLVRIVGVIDRKRVSVRFHEPSEIII